MALHASHTIQPPPAVPHLRVAEVVFAKQTPSFTSSDSSPSSDRYSALALRQNESTLHTRTIRTWGPFPFVRWANSFLSSPRLLFFLFVLLGVRLRTGLRTGLAARWGESKADAERRLYAEDAALVKEETAAAGCALPALPLNLLSSATKACLAQLTFPALPGPS